MKKLFLTTLFLSFLLPPLTGQILLEDSSGNRLSCRKIAVNKDGSIRFQLPATGDLWHRLPPEKCRKITLPKPAAIQDCDALFSAGKFRESALAFRREGEKDIYPTFYAYCLLYEVLSLEKAGRKKSALERLHAVFPNLHEREKMTASYARLLFHGARLFRENGEKKEALALLENAGKYAWGMDLAPLLLLKGDLLQEMDRGNEAVSAYFQLVLFFPENPLYQEALEKLYQALSARKDPRAEKFGLLLRQKKARNTLKK